jgi:hypothetical protein
MKVKNSQKAIERDVTESQLQYRGIMSNYKHFKAGWDFREEQVFATPIYSSFPPTGTSFAARRKNSQQKIFAASSLVR